MIIFHKSITKLILDIFEDQGEGTSKHSVSLNSPECALDRTSRLKTEACIVSEKFSKT